MAGAGRIDPEAFRQQGYVHMQGLLDAAEAAALRAEVHALAARRQHSDATWASVREQDQGFRLSHCHDVQFESAAFTRLLVHPRFTALATALVGPNVQLHHTKMFIKPPEAGAPFPLHQDYPYFPHARHSPVAVIVHLDDAPVERGCLRLIPGSHRLGPLPTVGSDHQIAPGAIDAAGAVDLPARAGDAIAFSYLTVHGSGINTSDQARTTLLIQLRDPCDPPTEARHQSRGQGMMIAGIDPREGSFRFAWDGDPPPG